MSLTYLCGPITGQSHDDARMGWRRHVYETLEGTTIKALSPMRHKTHLRHVQELSAMGEPNSVVSSPRGLTTRDRFDTTRCDVLFCNLIGADRVSIGSMIELGWADANRIPIILCIEPDGSNVHEHAMVHELTGFRCGSVDEGIEVLKAILIPAV